MVVAGMGGLGTAASIYLAAAGVGRLTLIGAGRVEISNLKRQVLHWPPDVKWLKTESATEKLHALNPSVSIDAKAEEITWKNIDELLGMRMSSSMGWIITKLAIYLVRRVCASVSLSFTELWRD